MMSTPINVGNIKFNIVHQHGSPNEATLVTGHKVFRVKGIFIKDLGREIPCAPYDDHFIYEEPTHAKGTWFAMCTCGSPAVIVDPSGYRRDSSSSGKMIICHYHGMHGHHATSDLGRH